MTKYDLWRDLAEKIYDEFLKECTCCGEIAVSEKDGIEIIEKAIKEFARERVVQIFFSAGKENE